MLSFYYTPSRMVYSVALTTAGGEVEAGGEECERERVAVYEIGYNLSCFLLYHLFFFLFY